MLRTLFWSWCINFIWLHIRPLLSHHWHVSICATLAPKIVSHCRGNQYQMSTGRRWQLASCRCQCGLQITWSREMELASLVTGYNTVVESLCSTLPTISSSHPKLPLVWPCNELLAGQQIATDINIQQAVTSWLQPPAADLFYTRQHTMVLQWDKWLDGSCDFVEVWLYYLLPMDI